MGTPIIKVVMKFTSTCRFNVGGHGRAGEQWQKLPGLGERLACIREVKQDIRAIGFRKIL